MPEFFDESDFVQPEEAPVSLFTPAENDLLALGNRAVEGFGSQADFADMLYRNLFQPGQLGGPRLFGLNQSPLNDAPEVKPSTVLKDAAESVYLYGPEKAQTTVGKLLEPGVKLAASSAGPGFTSILKPLALASGLGGLMNVEGASDKAIEGTEAVTLLSPLLLRGGLSGLSKLRGESLDEMGKAVSRSAMGVRASDYSNELDNLGPWILDQPKSEIASKVKTTMDELLDSKAFGNNFKPDAMVKTAIAEQSALTKEAGELVANATLKQTGPIKPIMTRTVQYINSGKVADPEAARKIAERFVNNIAGEGQGKLSYIQQQKITAGSTYEIGNDSINGLHRAIYHDLQKTVEKYVPKISGLNKQLQKWETITPILERQLGQGERANIVDWIKENMRTSGGTFTVPTLLAATLTGGTLGPAAAIPGALMGAAASRPGRLAIGNTLSGLSKTQPTIAGLANVYSDSGDKQGPQFFDESDFEDATSSEPNQLVGRQGIEPRSQGSLIEKEDKSLRAQKQSSQQSKQPLEGKETSSSNYNPVSSSYAIPHILNVPEVLSAKRKENMNDAKPASMEVLPGDNMGEFSPEVKQTVEVLKTAVRAQESGGNPRAISNKGARGLYQITPIAEKDVVLDTGWKNYDIYDPATNEAFYDHYMGKMVARFKDPKLALAAYNMGPTALDRIIAKLGTRDWDVISKYLKNKSSYLETVDYVPSILKNVDFTKA